MANNLQAEEIVSAGPRFVTAEVTAYGDATTHLPGCFLAIVSGSEGSQTFAEVVGGAGAVSAGVQRITLASDDPAVTHLAAIETAVEAIQAAQLADGHNVTVDNASLAVTQSGTWTIDLGATDNAVLDAIAASEASIDSKTPALGQALAAASVPVVLTAAQLTTLTPPAAITGFATAANQTTIIGHVDGLEGLLTTIDADTGTLAVVGGGAEATALRVTLASDSTGVLSVDDNGSTLSIDDGGGIITVDGTVAFSNTTIAVTNAGTFAVQAACTNAGTFAVQVDGSALTALQLIDDTVYTDDAAFTPGTSKVIAIGAQADEDSTDPVDEGDVGALRMTLERKLRTVASLDSAAMQSGNDQVTPKFAAISASSSGDNTLVSAVASKKIRVLSYYFTANGTVTVRFESGAGGTALSGQMDFIVNTGIVVPFSPVGHFETATNTLLNLELSGAVEVAGSLCYIEVD